MTAARRLLLAVACVALLCLPAGGQTASVWAANAFVDSVGVNLHLHYDSPAPAPYYTGFTAMSTALAASGIRHVRDGLVAGSGLANYHSHITTVGAYAPFTFIVPISTAGSAMTTFEGLVGSAIEAYEGPNEHDATGGAWATDLASYLPTLYAARHGYPMVGPSLILSASYDTIGSVCASQTYSNIHPYKDGRHPESGGWGDGGYGSNTYWLSAAAVQCSSTPVYATETGWFSDATIDNYVTEAVQAKYTVRALLEQYRVGIARTYLYEFADFPGSGVLNLNGYGLLHEDLSPKPAYTAVSALLGLLNDTGTPTVPLGPLDYVLSGNDADVRNMAFRKRDGTYLLALWVASASWTPGAAGMGAPISVPTQSVGVTVPAGHAAARVHQFQADGSIAVTTLAGSTTASLTVSDTVQFLEVQRRPPVRVRRF